MRSWQLLLAFVGLTAATCYLPNGQEADEQWVPCANIDTFSFCCQAGDTCLGNGLCQAQDVVQMGACQNSDWSGCHQELAATVALELRQVPLTTEVVVGGNTAQSTIVVIATQTTSFVYVSASQTSTTVVTETTKPTESSKPKHELNLPLIIGCAGGGAVGIAIFLGILCICLRRQKQRRRLQKRRADEEFRNSTMSPEMMREPTLPVITENWRRPIIMRDKKPVSMIAEMPGNTAVEMDEGVKADKRRDTVEIDSSGNVIMPVEMDSAARPIEIDDGNRLDLPVEMDAGRIPAGSHQPPWAGQRNMYEMG